MSSSTSTTGGGVGHATRAAAQKSRARAARTAAKGSSGNGGVGGGGGGGGYAGGGNSMRLDRAGLKGKRGWAKKGGGGHGKFTWGRPGDEMNDLEMLHDDPNYDSVDEEDDGHYFATMEDRHQQMARKAGISLDGFQGGGHLFGAPPPSAVANAEPGTMSLRLPDKLPLKVFKEKCVEIVDEYLTSEDVDELKEDLLELHSPMLHYEFVRKAITLAMERNARERELLSCALSDLYGDRIISAEQCGKGFERLFEISEDLTLDIPRAKKYISQFLARAVADEILPPSFLSDPLIVRLGGEMVDQAKVLLSIKHGLVRLDHVWGTTSHASVAELKQEIKMVLEEFFNSSDLDEACACIKRLNVPHFHHEVVKRAVVLSLDRRDREQAMMSALFAELSSRGIISERQMEMGFQRLFTVVSDLELDAPGAGTILDVFLAQAVKDRCLSASSAAVIRQQKQ